MSFKIFIESHHLNGHFWWFWEKSIQSISFWVGLVSNQYFQCCLKLFCIWKIDPAESLPHHSGFNVYQPISVLILISILTSIGLISKCSVPNSRVWWDVAIHVWLCISNYIPVSSWSPTTYQSLLKTPRNSQNFSLERSKLNPFFWIAAPDQEPATSIIAPLLQIARLVPLMQEGRGRFSLLWRRLFSTEVRRVALPSAFAAKALACVRKSLIPGSLCWDSNAAALISITVQRHGELSQSLSPYALLAATLFPTGNSTMFPHFRSWNGLSKVFYQDFRVWTSLLISKPLRRLCCFALWETKTRIRASRLREVSSTLVCFPTDLGLIITTWCLPVPNLLG